MKSLTFTFLLLISFFTIASEKVIGIDVRTWPERKLNPAPNSLALSNDELKEELERRKINKDQKIVVFCESGGRASRTLDILKSLGYKNSKNIGSWREWNRDYSKK